MTNVFSRPLFKGNFIKKYAEGGIVSTVVGPEEEMAAQPMQPDQDPMRILSDMAMQVDATEKNLDAAGNIDEILSSFTGMPKTAQDARMELAELVGQNDAAKTPDSVLALVQPAMTILEMSRKMQPPGGIADVPMQQPMEGEGAPMGAAPFQGGQIPGFADGGEVDANSLIAKYQAMQNAVPANYGSDPASAWMALAQFGAGLAQGKTFTEGMSMGTQAAGPYMAQAISDRNRRRDALSAFIAEEQARKEARAQGIEDREDQQEFQKALTQLQVGAQANESALNRSLQSSIHLDELNWKKQEFDLNWQKTLEQKTLENEAEYKLKLAEASSAEEKERLSQEFELKKLDLQHRMDLQKIEFENRIKPAQTDATERMINGLMERSGLQKGSPEYNALYDSLVKDALAKSGGTTINLGSKGSEITLKNQSEYETKEVADLKKQAEAARQTRSALAPVRVQLEPIREGKSPAYVTGGLGEAKLLAGQVLTDLNATFDLGLGEAIPQIVGGDPAAGELLRAQMAKLQVAAAENLSRATNLQVTLAQDMFPKLSMTPEGNLMIADLLDRSAERTLKLEEYANQLQRTYGGTIDPAIKPVDYRDELLRSAGVTAFNGYEKGTPFDKNGKPIMSLSEYRMFLDKTEPVLKPEEIARLQKMVDNAPASWQEASEIWRSGAPAPNGGEPWAKLRAGTVFEMGGQQFLRTRDGIVPYKTGGR